MVKTRKMRKIRKNGGGWDPTGNKFDRSMFVADVKDKFSNFQDKFSNIQHIIPNMLKKNGELPKMIESKDIEINDTYNRIKEQKIGEKVSKINNNYICNLNSNDINDLVTSGLGILYIIDDIYQREFYNYNKYLTDPQIEEMRKMDYDKLNQRAKNDLIQKINEKRKELNCGPVGSQQEPIVVEGQMPLLPELPQEPIVVEGQIQGGKNKTKKHKKNKTQKRKHSKRKSQKNKK